MKKYIFAIIGLVILGACSSDDNGSQAINLNNLIGKWYLKGGTTNGGAFENYNHECVTSKDYQEFFANGDLDFVGHDVECEVNDTDSSQWSISGNILTVSNQEFDPMIYSYEYTIESITSEELRLKETVEIPGGTETRIIYMTRN
ncbi:lipocalin family protein [Flavobacterium soli]|uniref:lipocalin family protein n=1 Tax=Flavobacterium soli TaxID=344881 RepID=UPI000407BC57|nr:lipocalin family protein [Flavobacterium soli]